MPTIGRRSRTLHESRPLKPLDPGQPCSQRQASMFASDCDADRAPFLLRKVDNQNERPGFALAKGAREELLPQLPSPQEPLAQSQQFVPGGPVLRAPSHRITTLPFRHETTLATILVIKPPLLSAH